MKKREKRKKSENTFFVFVSFAVKKAVKDETDDRMPQFKKKAKELRILDAKTAQNLCKHVHLYVFIVFSWQ